MTDVMRPVDGQLEERVRQLETALETRIVIEQAKGVLAGRHGVDIETGFEAMRAASRATHQRLRELARRVVEESSTPDEITLRLMIGAS